MTVVKFLFLFVMYLTILQRSMAQVSNKTQPENSVVYGSNTSTGKYIKLRGFNLYYETYGKGEPLLISHGNGGSINNFKFQIPHSL